MGVGVHTPSLAGVIGFRSEDRMAACAGPHNFAVKEGSRALCRSAARTDIGVQPAQQQQLVVQQQQSRVLEQRRQRRRRRRARRRWSVAQCLFRHIGARRRRWRRKQHRRRVTRQTPTRTVECGARAAAAAAVVRAAGWRVCGSALGGGVAAAAAAEAFCAVAARLHMMVTVCGSGVWAYAGRCLRARVGRI